MNNIISVNLPLHTGETLVVEIPKSLSVCPLPKIIEFDLAYEELTEWAEEKRKAHKDKEDAKMDTGNSLEYMVLLAKCISAFSEHEVDEVLETTYSNALDDQMFTLYPLEEIDELGGIVAGLTQVFNIIWSLRTTYKYNGKGNIFEYKNKLWTIPEQKIHNLTGATDYDIVSVGQLVSIFRQKKALEATKDVLEKDRRFTDRLRTLVILAECEDGTKYDGTDKYVDTMVPYFKDIDAQTAEDANFFLLTTSLISNPSLKIDGFLTHPTYSAELLSRRINRKLKTIKSGIA